MRLRTPTVRALTSWLSPHNLADMDYGWRQRALLPYSLVRDHLAYLALRDDIPGQIDLASLCIVLGPYRNLTTLTAGIMMLHPSCQVLNHAATRILPISSINFLLDYSDKKFDRFVRSALAMSVAGKRGDFGGSILHSHAFDDDKLRDTYQRRYGDSIIKENVQCLIWKDSMKLQNYIRHQQICLIKLCESNPKIRFILPIRNPIDCAISNIKTGKAGSIVGNKSYIFDNVIDEIIKGIAWFLANEERNTVNFYHFTEHDVNQQLLYNIADFLQIEAAECWLEDGLSTYAVRQSYDHDRGFRDIYLRSVERHLKRWPHVAEKLVAMAVQH